jgi:hypothetical protein
MLNERISPEYTEVFSKKFYAVRTSLYDSLGNSAGQDNLGQIITAILSFERLRNTLGGDYFGGLLLIDELDATLFAAAQEKLVNTLFEIAKDLNLQVIFTTHSIEILKQLMLPQFKKDSEVIFLDNSSGKVINAQNNNVSLTQMINNICVLYPTIEKETKIMAFCEDQEANLWLRNLLGSRILKKLHIIPDNFGGGNLVYIANKKIPVFKRSIFVLDGDQGRKLKDNKCPRVITLPGQQRPEDIFYNYLKNDLPANDKFWDRTGGYTQQVCFRDCPTISTDRNIMKNWFRAQMPYWGSGGSRLFNRWKEDNAEVTVKFKEDFGKLLETVFRGS